jgi:hypothetical protein
VIDAENTDRVTAHTVEHNEGCSTYDKLADAWVSPLATEVWEVGQVAGRTLDPFDDNCGAAGIAGRDIEVNTASRSLIDF